ncbi:MAG: SpoIID/LytB domain-containing protein [Thermoleophilia bacterium]
MRALLAAVLTSLVAASASAAATPLFLISGGGWGHGVGLSQCGAYGFAKQGATYDRILATYYPGTQLGPAPTSSIRVLLVDASSSVTVSSRGAFSATDGSGAVVQLPAGSATVTSGLVLSAGGSSRPITLPLRFSPGKQPLQLGDPYRGDVVVTANGGSLRAVNDVALEQYLYGVVPGEMSASWAVEALKAQAVAARSYALASRSTTGAFDVYADTRSQVYGGIEDEDPRTSAAIDATAGQVLTFKGKVAQTFFFASSGGRTAAVQDVWSGGPIPYLVSVEDPYDDVCSTHHRWGPIAFTGTDLSRALGGPTPLVDAVVTLNGSGRVETLALVGRKRTTTIEGTDVRSELGLSSTMFSVSAIGIDRTPSRAAFGRALTLTGVARAAEGAVLETSSDGRAWREVGPLAVDGAGRFAVTVKPTVAARYRVNAPGLVGVVDRLPQVRIAVVPSIALSVDAGVASGRVRPKLAGAGIKIQRKDGRRWTTLASGKLDATGRFAIPVADLSGKVRARVAPTGGMPASASAVLSVVAA